MTDQAAPPPELADLAPGWMPELAYRLVSDVTTWRLRNPMGGVRYAKVDAAATRYPTLSAEAERMIWAAPYLPVPEVVACTRVGAVGILITEAIPGCDATHPAWRDDLPALVSALGRGLRSFHEAVEEEWCPFRFDVARALDHVARRVAAGTIGAADFHPEHERFSAASALAELVATAPPHEDLVVCHGDYCPPNVLLEDGRVTGYVDLGELGVADRWWDIAVGAWSTGWNYGPEFEPLFYESYGVEPDPERIAFYRLLYDVVS
ncbi:MAG TPA: aminoglycoside 3'-phosphotransferase [Acidimicrobiales bacterium]|nr:aminoglycoside 3'-phosphotransferase [Acidimicrobiales bacterium]